MTLNLTIHIVPSDKVPKYGTRRWYHRLFFLNPARLIVKAYGNYYCHSEHAEYFAQCMRNDGFPVQIHWEDYEPLPDNVVPLGGPKK